MFYLPACLASHLRICSLKRLHMCGPLFEYCLYDAHKLVSREKFLSTMALLPKLEESSKPTKRIHLNTKGSGEGRRHQILQLIFHEKLFLRHLVFIKPKSITNGMKNSLVKPCGISTEDCEAKGKIWSPN